MTRCMSSITENYDIKNVNKIIDYYRSHSQLYTCKELGCNANCSSIPKLEEILELTYRKMLWQISILDNGLYAN